MDIETLFTILLQEKPSIQLRKKEELLFEFIPELRLCKNFNQNNIWHQYDVLEHIYHVVDNVPNSLVLRLAALFHDIGKPLVYTEDENKVGHFYKHWEVSQNIFLNFCDKNNISKDIRNTVSKLILYHDKNINKLSEEQLSNLTKNFTQEEIVLLFELKKADLFAQNEKFHYLANDYKVQKNKLLEKY